MSERIPWLDGWRGAAVWLMLVYHLLFDFIIFGWMEYAVLEAWPMVLFERVIAWSFILCAGICAVFTRSNLKRGLVTLAAGGAVTAVSYLIGAPIKFGILQFLGLAMLLYAAAGRLTERLPEKLAPVLWVLLYVVSELVTSRVSVQARWLFWLGFLYEGFESVDYFPVLPHIFLFLLGSWMGVQIRKRREELPFLTRSAPAFLTWPGRHSLLVYLLHQPVLFGGCLVIYLLTR